MKHYTYFKQLPITFKLSDEEVDILRDAAQLLLNNDAEFQQLLKDRR
jgi:hypothetical protein